MSFRKEIIKNIIFSLLIIIVWGVISFFLKYKVILYVGTLGSWLTLWINFLLKKRESDIKTFTEAKEMVKKTIKEKDFDFGKEEIIKVPVPESKQSSLKKRTLLDELEEEEDEDLEEEQEETFEELVLKYKALSKECERLKEKHLNLDKQRKLFKNKLLEMID